MMNIFLNQFQETKKRYAKAKIHIATFCCTGMVNMNKDSHVITFDGQAVKHESKH